MASSPVIDPRVSSHFSVKGTFVDLGCGDGKALDAVSSLFACAVGIDIESNTRVLEHCRTAAWDFMLADLNKGIPLASDSVEVVHANQVIEHLSNPLAFLGEAYRVLKPEAVLLVTTPNIRYLRHVWRLVVRGQGPITSQRAVRTPEEWDDGHIHFFTPTDLEWIAAQVGFRSVKSQGLIDSRGPLRLLRSILRRGEQHSLVKGFLSGNTLLVARK